MKFSSLTKPIFYNVTIFNKQPKTFYEILKVPQNAPPDEIKKSYLKLVKKYHPDTNKDNGSEEAFKEIVNAYETLKDPIKR